MLRIEGYRLTGRVYEGARTHIYRGVRNADALPVVLKTSRSPQPTQLESSRLTTEYELGRKVESPHVVRFLAQLRDGHRPVLVMEDIDGIPLDSLLRDGALALESFIALALPLTRGLAALHEKRILHRDVNPSNAIVQRSVGGLQLIDLGLASLLEQERRQATSIEQLEGTLPYISPEQTGRTNSPIDQRSDLYSLGVTFYQLLCGCLPFESDDPAEVVHAHIARAPEPPAERRSSIPLAISEVVVKLLAKAPGARYQTATGLLADLERCQLEMTSKGRISSFDLGSRDRAARLRVPEKLYGRSRERDRLDAAFARAREGSRALALLNGPAGLGKSSISLDFYRRVMDEGVFFAGGRFDAQTQDKPYSALITAVERLIRDLLARDEEQVLAWRERLEQVLGDEGRVLTDILPHVELLLGEQPAVRELNPADAERRFSRLVCAFFAAFAQVEAPLVIALDDLHWADHSSVRLIELLLHDERLHHLLIVGSHRGVRALDENESLAMMLRRVEEGPAELYLIDVGALKVGHVNQLLVDTLGCSDEEAEGLAESLHKKTAGNPGFLRQLLRTLVDEGLLAFDGAAWRWDLAAIEARAPAESAVALLLEKMEALAPETQEMLELAAGIGRNFDVGTVSVLAARPVHEVAAALLPAVEADIVRATSGGFSQLVMHRFANDCCPLEQASAVKCAFVHDRFVQAAYARLSPERCEKLHLELGRLLRDRLQGNEREERLFEIVRHLQLAGPLIVEPNERLEVARLTYQAGLKAKAGVAFEMARSHFSAARELLPAERWERHYELTFAICLDLYQTAMTLRLKEPWALELGHELLEHARGRVHALRALAPHLAVLARAGEPERAIELALRALKDAGMEISAEGDLDQALSEQRARIEGLVAGRSFEELALLPLVEDEERLAVLQLRGAMVLPLYMRRRDLLALVEAAGVSYSLAHGYAPTAGMSYAGWARVLAHKLGDYQRAYAFAQLGRAVADRTGVARPAVYALVAAFVDWLRDPLGVVIERVRDAFRMGVESGEAFYAALAASQFSSLAFGHGVPLETLAAECVPFERYIGSNMGDVGMREIHVTMRAVDVLRGERGGIFAEDEDKEAIFADMRQRNPEGLCWYHLIESQLAYLHRRYDDALAHAEQALKPAVMELGTFFGYDAVFRRGLAAARASADDARAKLDEGIQCMTGWVQAGAGSNFRHKLAILEAEEARLAGETDVATAAYERAIEGAQRLGFLPDLAVANELAGLFFLERGLDKVARVYLGEAHYCYQKWGAATKARELLLKDPLLFDGGLSRLPSASHELAVAGGSDREPIERSLDFASVLKATRVISSEMVIDALLEKLLGIVAQNAGAERGALLLRNADGQLDLVGSVEHGEARHLSPARPMAASEELAAGVVYYVARTQEQVVLADATSEGRFRADPYVSKRRPRSLLCTPLSHQGKLVGVVYLENNLVAGAFTSQRLEVVRLLAAQAAVSITNARLFAELASINRTLEEKVEARTRDLADKNEQLNRSVEREREMQRQLSMSDKMASLGNLVAGVAHEINTPVGAVTSSVDTAGRSAQRLQALIEKADDAAILRQDKRVQRLFRLLATNHEVIGTASARVAEIVRTLRSFARLDEAERQQADLHEGLDSTLSLARHRLKVGISVERDYGDLPLVSCYPNQLNQVFMNLLINAIDAIEHVDDGRTGKITIETRKGPSEVEIAFTDNGAGIDAEARDRIFNPGFTTKGVGVGTGLGLSICFNIVQKHRGRIEVQSEAGKGSTFSVHLPIE